MVDYLLLPASLPARFHWERVLFPLSHGCWSWSRPLKTILVIPPDTAQHVWDVPQKQLSRFSVSLSLPLLKIPSKCSNAAVSSCVERIELARKPDGRPVQSICIVFKIQTPDCSFDENRTHLATWRVQQWENCHFRNGVWSQIQEEQKCDTHVTS